MNQRQLYELFEFYSQGSTFLVFASHVISTGGCPKNKKEKSPYVGIDKVK